MEKRMNYSGIFDIHKLILIYLYIEKSRFFKTIWTSFLDTTQWGQTQERNINKI